ncbi:MAG TPA: hypothetical protein VHA33_06620 [Candidatus Angelobacter sp.]|jgi:hypothetical protein|nr:hypothetical protein [Candidatus Angelobacter sp.]
MKTANGNNGHLKDALLVLNGLFYLEHKDDVLIITAPDIPDHKYYIGIPGDLKELKEMPRTVDLRSFLLGRQDNEFKFPPEIPQFSKSETGTGNIAATGRFQAIVPIPLEIYALRKGSIKDFHPVEKSIVGKNILKSSGPELGTQTCLQYKGHFPQEWTPTQICHFYAENVHELAIKHVNHAYRMSRTLFSYPDKFDLRMDNHFQLLPIPPHNDEQLKRLKLSLSDQLNLDELNLVLPDTDTAAANVANCVQLAMTA